MKAKTINISLPQSLYEELKKKMKRYHYSSASELIRDALRWWMNPRLTRNGFTPEFERAVLRSAAEPIENDVQWDGKGSFVDFVLKHPIKKHGKHTIYRKVSSRPQKSLRLDPDDWERSRQAYPVV